MGRENDPLQLHRRFYPPAAGRFSSRGRHHRFALNEICLKGIARTFQLVRVFKDMPVLDNVMIGAFNRTGSASVAAKRRWRSWSSAGSWPRRACCRRAHHRRQERLELAKAFATGPTLLLLDEAMAGLNQTRPPKPWNW